MPVDLLKAAEDAVTGTRGDVELLDSGTYIVIEPNGQDTVAVSKCFDLMALDNSSGRIFDPVFVSEEVVLAEIIRVTEEWRDDALNANPDIGAVDWFDDLQ